MHTSPPSGHASSPPSGTPAFSVVICTRNPDRRRLRRVLESLAAQTFDHHRWELTLVDNGSSPPVEPPHIEGLPPCRIVTEPTPGLTRARLTAIHETCGELLVFVDDDTLLAPDYLAHALDIAHRFPQLGAFGGQLAGEFETPPPAWLIPYLPNLAVVSLTHDLISDRPTDYHTIPCGAGLCLRRTPATRYAREVAADPRRMALDRQDTSTHSCGDWDIALTALDDGWSMGRFTRLQVTHVIPASRLTYEANRRLAYGIGHSMGTLLELRRHAPPWHSLRRLLRTLAAFLGLKGLGHRRGMDFSYQLGLLHGSRTVRTSRVTRRTNGSSAG